MANSTISCRLPKEVLRVLDELAGATARNRNYLITEAVKEYVARETWRLQRIREGLRQVDAGEVVSSEQMDEFWSGWITPEARAEAAAAPIAEPTV
jgi:RHH-type transcriptional regulator, rel operon repressor / antitoxin RelB